MPVSYTHLTITPKNYVLPFLKEHFCSRLMNETFLIFDRTHKAAPVSYTHLDVYKRQSPGGSFTVTVYSFE